MNTTTITAQGNTAVEAETVERRTRFARAGLVAGIAAAVANTVVVAVADSAGVPLNFHNDPRPIPLLGFAQVTIFATLIGLGLATVLRRRSVRPAALFTRITVALTAVSMIPPVLVDADLSTKALLVATHLIAAAIVIPVVAKRLAR
jgi:hypothetical protein